MKCLGIDVGGTFTDLIILDSDKNYVRTIKVSSTPENQSIGINTGLAKIISDIKDLDALVHGTTVATNAILTKTGAKTALITTKGFRDVIEIGRQNRTNLYSLYPSRTPLLIPRSSRYEISERLSSKGEIVESLDLQGLEEIIRLLKKESIESLAVSLLFSFFNPVHEKQIERKVKEEIPGIIVSRSSKVLPVFREYSRSYATVLDAYVAPLMVRYFSSFLEKIHEKEINIPPLILLSTGGVTQINTAAEKSVETILSGLAGGVLGGLYSCSELGIKDALTLDIGGTSTDVASVVQGKIEITTENEIAGYPLPLPTIAVKTIGAGGGSIAKFEHGIFRVGPESAGAEPGPACYNKGGNNATVTDANLILGMLNPDYFCGGTIKIYPELSVNVLERLAEELNFSTIQDCASGIIEIFENNVALALRKVSTERGHDTRDFTLIAFGGAGPLHGCSLAERLSMKQVVIPPYPGVWSAFGLLTADIRHDLSKSILKPIDEINQEDLELEFSELSKQGFDLCLKDGFESKDVLISRTLDVRLIGQSYELTVPYYGKLGAVAHYFDRVHEQTYGYSSPDTKKEIVNIRVAAMVPLPKFNLTSLEKGSQEPNDEAFVGEREIFHRGGWTKAQVFKRTELKWNNIIKGPAIIEQDDSTTFIDRNWSARVMKDGHILIRRNNIN
ncbi:MAG: hydantoinase/oxoprolinase family protein [Candidatus Hodarchaeales archaeon]